MTERIARLPREIPRPTLSGTGLILATGLVLLAAWTGPLVDWTMFLLPASKAILHGESPYSIPGYYKPPWIAVLLTPIAALPEEVAAMILPIVAVAVWILLAFHLGASSGVITALLLSPPVLTNIYNGQVEWMLMLALVMPPRWGLFFALAKPQVGVGLAVLWLIDAWRKGGWQEVARVFGPLAGITTLSIMVFGAWFSRASGLPDDPTVSNMSLWPYAIPIGVWLMVTSIRRRTWPFALASANFLSPYLALYSYSSVMIALLVMHPRWLATVVLATWALLIVLAI